MSEQTRSCLLIFVSEEKGVSAMSDSIREKLRKKAGDLPLSPGVYLMKNADGKIIYVGKSKVLRNRVSQYFADTEKEPKTAAMVAAVRDFSYMLTDTETEAFTLENKLIKLHMPKYNILLKDGKNYPYIKVTMDEPYPRVLMARRRSNDRAKYFGPYSSSFMAGKVIKTVNRAFSLPTCTRKFPRDIGKERPCLYSQIGQCCAVCSGKVSREEYRESFREILFFLRGNFGEVKKSLEEKMRFASENLAFEAAALYRDRIKSLSLLWEKQKIVGAPGDEYDVLALYTHELSSCLAVYYVRDGAVIDSDNFVFSGEKLVDGESLTSFLCGLYDRRDYLPRTLYIGFDLEEEQRAFLSSYLTGLAEGRKVTVHRPQRGEHKKLCDMVAENARIHATAYNAEAERDNEVLLRLSTLLGLEVLPERIEAIDISNYGSDNLTAGLIALENGRFSKKNYRTYKIRSVTGKPDDYASMREAVERRLSHAEEDPLPDLLLLDGGRTHVAAVKALLEEKGVYLPVFGMVKDEFHKTRALTDEESEISIAREHSVFVFIYKIQEEVHRFAIRNMKNAKSKTLTRSSLEKIEGIGPRKAAMLLGHFKTLTRLSEASAEEIAAVKGIGAGDARRILDYFAKKRAGKAEAASEAAKESSLSEEDSEEEFSEKNAGHALPERDV